MTEKNENRSSGTRLVIVLILCGVIAGIMMVRLSAKALRMDPDALMINKLMSRRSIACSESSASHTCQKATDALNKFQASIQGKSKKIQSAPAAEPIHPITK